MKKLRLLIFLSVIMLLFSSCTAVDKEIKNRLIIEGVGIDYDNEKEEFALTVQVLETSGPTDESGQSAPVTNYTVTGKTVASALNSLWENTGKYPLYSQNRIIIIGESLNGDKITEALDFFVREYTARADVFVAATTGKASDILLVQIGSEITAKMIENEINEGIENSAAVNTELYNVVNLSMEATTSFTLPLLEISEDRNADSSTVKITGTYCNTKNGKKNHLSAEETMMLKFITDNIKVGTLSINIDGTTTGLDIISSSTDIKTLLKDGNPHFDINIDCSVDIIEYGNTAFTGITKETIEKVQSYTQEHINSSVTALIERQLKTEKCDIFRFGRRLQLKYPEIYKELSSDWENALSKFSFSVKTNVTVRKIGQETIKQ